MCCVRCVCMLSVVRTQIMREWRYCRMLPTFSTCKSRSVVVLHFNSSLPTLSAAAAPPRPHRSRRFRRGAAGSAAHQVVGGFDGLNANGCDSHTRGVNYYSVDTVYMVCACNCALFYCCAIGALLRSSVRYGALSPPPLCPPRLLLMLVPVLCALLRQ